VVASPVIPVAVAIVENLFADSMFGHIMRTELTASSGREVMDRESEAVTKPTLETILERINSVSDGVTGLRDEFGSLRDEFGSLRNEFQLFRGEFEIRIDRIEGLTNQTRAEMLTLRADFREFRNQSKEPVA